MNRKSRLLSLLILFVLALLLLVPAAAAYDGRTGDRVVIGPDEVINDDLFAGANSVIVDGTIHGDLLAAARTVVVNGRVTGNVIAAGSSVFVNGEVGYDVIAAGASVTIGPEARIGHNAYTAGGSVESQAGSLVEGSLLIGAGQGLVSGQVANDLLAAADRLRLENAVGRNAKIAVSASDDDWSPSFLTGPNVPPLPYVQSGLTFGAEARVAGSLEYVSPRAVEAAAGVSANVVHTLPPQDQQLAQELARRRTASSRAFDALRRLAGLLLVGLLLAWLAPRWVTIPAERLRSRPWSSLGLGLAGLFGAPLGWLVALGVLILVAVLLGLLSLGVLTGLTLLAGLPALGLALAAFVLVLAFLCQAVVAYLFGRWLLDRIRPQPERTIFAPLLLGLFILGLLFAVPVAGGILQFLVVVFGLGAVILALFRRRRPPQAAAEAPVQAPAEPPAAVQA